MRKVQLFINIYGEKNRNNVDADLRFSNYCYFPRSKPNKLMVWTSLCNLAKLKSASLYLMELTQPVLSISTNHCASLKKYIYIYF